MGRGEDLCWSNLRELTRFSEHLLVLGSIGRTEREQPLPPGSRVACSLHGDQLLVRSFRTFEDERQGM